MEDRQDRLHSANLEHARHPRPCRHNYRQVREARAGLVEDRDSGGIEELEGAGYELLHPPREEPWGQTVARLQSPEGAIIGIAYTPLLHDED